MLDYIRARPCRYRCRRREIPQRAGKPHARCRPEGGRQKSTLPPPFEVDGVFFAEQRASRLRFVASRHCDNFAPTNNHAQIPKCGNVNRRVPIKNHEICALSAFDGAKFILTVASYRTVVSGRRDRIQRRSAQLHQPLYGRYRIQSGRTERVALLHPWIITVITRDRNAGSGLDKCGGSPPVRSQLVLRKGPIRLAV